MPRKYASLLTCFLAERKSLAKYLTNRTGCAATADDLLQDAWLKLHRIPEAEPVANPLAYLHRMATNLAIDNARAHARRLLDPVEIELLLDVPDQAPPLDQQIEDAQILKQLQRVLEEMPKRRRDIFLAARIEGLPHRHLAERFGVSLRTVELEVHRALDQCTERLRKLTGESAQ
jgi:RNA polymerase sigma-70 factor (ECF subfamily)